VDTVKINTIKLFYGVTSAQSSSTLYSDTNQTSVYNNVNWYIKGNNNFNTINQSVTRGYPAYTNSTALLPTQVSKAQGVIINFNNSISNADSIMVIIQDHTNASFEVSKTVVGSSTGITFSSNDLLGLTTGGNPAQIYIASKNYSNLSANTKVYVFIMYSSLSGYVTINP